MGADEHLTARAGPQQLSAAWLRLRGTAGRCVLLRDIAGRCVLLRGGAEALLDSRSSFVCSCHSRGWRHVPATPPGTAEQPARWGCRPGAQREGRCRPVWCSLSGCMPSRGREGPGAHLAQPSPEGAV